jgi:hypothetical protein
MSPGTFVCALSTPARSHQSGPKEGVEAKTIVVEQLARALEIIRQLNPARNATLGGECSVSVAPFSA